MAPASQNFVILAEIVFANKHDLGSQVPLSLNRQSPSYQFRTHNIPLTSCNSHITAAHNSSQLTLLNRRCSFVSTKVSSYLALLARLPVAAVAMVVRVMRGEYC
jgi:hypothetical protein